MNGSTPSQQTYSFLSSLSAVYPKKQSKILAGIKHEEEIGARRARNFMAKCDQITEMRKQRKKHGKIEDKDLSKLRSLFIER